MKIGIFNVSSPISPAKLELGLAWLSEQGHTAEVLGDPSKNYGLSDSLFAAGSPEERVEWLSKDGLQREGPISLLLAARGGHGALEIVDRLGETPLVRSQVPLCGFSDCTALLVTLRALGRKEGLWHGPSLLSLAVGHARDDFLALVERLENQTQSKVIIKAEDLQSSTEGAYHGEILAGNLTVLAALCGSDSLNYTSSEGIVLCIEDVGEEPYRAHRALLQLWRSDFFAQVNAIVAGEFLRCEAAHGKGPSTEEVLKRFCAERSIPLFQTSRFGHGRANVALPHGQSAFVSRDSGLSLG